MVIAQLDCVRQRVGRKLRTGDFPRVIFHSGEKASFFFPLQKAISGSIFTILQPSLASSSRANPDVPEKITDKLSISVRVPLSTLKYCEVPSFVPIMEYVCAFTPMTFYMGAVCYAREETSSLDIRGRLCPRQPPTVSFLLPTSCFLLPTCYCILLVTVYPLPVTSQC